MKEMKEMNEMYSQYEKLVKDVESDVLRRLCKRGYSESELLSSLYPQKESSVSEKSCVLEKSLEKSCVLPWCGEIMSGKCLGLKYNGGLYTQCRENSSEYCASCLKARDVGGGVLPYGTVMDRKSVGIMEYKDSRGRSPLSYVKVMKKKGMSMEEVFACAERVGVVLPKCHFEESNVVRGRPKKAESSVEVEKKKRGRPRKEKEVVSNTAGEELIASLLEHSVEPCLSSALAVEIESCAEESDVETSVVKFELCGKEYLRSIENILYDIESHDQVGFWNESTNRIEEIPDEE